MSEPPGASVVLAGGGSAGHTSPLIATANELRELRGDVRLTAVGTERGLEVSVIPAAGLQLELVPAVPLPRRPTLDLVKVPFRLAGAVSAAAAILRNAEANVVLGFGGYVSTPVYLAARWLRVPIVIHEQNVLPGLANRVAARFTSNVYTAFPETPLPHAEWIGLPMRRAITTLDRAASAAEARAAFGLAADLPVLLVSGGSQGAQSINSAVTGAREALLAAGVQILHVLGPGNIGRAVRLTDPSTGANYRPLAYVERMEQAYAAADLMLARCGAGTVMETAAVGLPSIYVPYPHGNGEQRRNATLVLNAGGGELLGDAECSADEVIRRVLALVEESGRLAGMSAAMRGVAALDAAATLARATLEVAQPWPNR